jgi:hypothetical protein
MTTRVNPSLGDPDVVYAKYTTDHDGKAYQVQGEDILLTVRAVATIVRRRDLGGWRIHAVGGYLPPDKVPH